MIFDVCKLFYMLNYNTYNINSDYVEIQHISATLILHA